MLKLLRKIYRGFEKIGSFLLFENCFRNRQLKIIQKFATGVDSILELGVGTKSYFHKNNRGYKIVGFDIYETSLKKAKQMGQLDDYIIGNVNELNKCIKPNSFDLVVAFDLIEHLKKEDGYKLIENMKKIAKKRIIIYTPNGFQYQPPRPDNPYQEHISGWDYWEMKKLGFEVIGINGYKKLRGMYALPKYRPFFIFNFFTFLSEIFLHKIKKDDIQYAILCYKDI